MPDRPPPPQRTPPPYQNGEGEPITGVFTPRTGHTRRMVKWGALIAAGAGLLSPIFNAIGARIAPPPADVQQCRAELSACRESLKDAGR